MNTNENIKRKQLSSIEVGRICKILRNEHGLNSNEISVKLGIKNSRVSSSIKAYEVTAGTPFEKLVKYGIYGVGTKGMIPESLIWHIQTSLSRAYTNKKIPSQDWKILLKAMETGLITTKTVSALRRIIYNQDKKNLNKALDILKNCKICYIDLPLNEKVLNKMLEKEKLNNDKDLIKKIIRDYNKELMF